MIRVLLVDDNTEYVRVFSLTLDWQPDMEVVGIAGTLAEARTMLEGVDVAIPAVVVDSGYARQDESVGQGHCPE